MAAQQTHQPRPYNNGYLPNGAPPAAPVPGATPLLPNQGRVVQAGSARILCVADVRGDLKSLNDLAKQARADYIIHTGDFGFYDDRSLDRIAEKTLKHVAQYSPLISEDVRRQVTNWQHNSSIKEHIPRNVLPLSQLPQFLDNRLSFDVPVYTVWGACEDVQVLEKLRSGEYKIDKLHIIDEAHSRLLELGGVKLRLLGLGGAVVMHKLFDNGEGRTTIAGGQGTMWTTLLQMGELIDTANRVYDPSETRLLVTHASLAREGLLNQLAVNLKVDFSISAGLHFRYGSSYNEFSVNPTLDHYRGKLAASKASFTDVWETVRPLVEPVVEENETQQKLLQNALEIVNKMPSVANGGNPFGGQVGPSGGQIDEMAFKNMWNFNLADAAFGWLVLEIDGGRIGTEMKAQGFNFAHRGSKPTQLQADMIKPSAPSPSVPGAPNAQLPMQGAQPGQALPPGVTGAPLNAPPAYQQPQQMQQPRRQQPQQPSASRGVQSPATAQTQSPQPISSQTTTNPPAVASTPSPAPPAQAATVAIPPSAESAQTPETKTNGMAPSAPADAARTTSSPVDKKPSKGIFIQNVNTEDDARKLFSEEDKAKIVKLDRQGRFFVAEFQSTEEMQAVLNRTAATLEKGHGKPTMSVYNPRPARQGEKSYADWGNRRGGGTQQSGYRSGGGGASDSEGGRGGRGSYRGGRGGDRGSERGNPARGRGGFRKPSGTEGGAITSTSPAPASTGTS